MDVDVGFGEVDCLLSGGRYLECEDEYTTCASFAHDESVVGTSKVHLMEVSRCDEGRSTEPLYLEIICFDQIEESELFFILRVEVEVVEVDSSLSIERVILIIYYHQEHVNHNGRVYLLGC